MEWVTCLREPNGSAGLRGYRRGERYRCEKNAMPEYWLTFYRLWRNTDDPLHYDTLSESILLQFFEPIDTE